MVKSYSRYEAGARFGVVTGNSNVSWIPSKAGEKGPGFAVVGGLEDVLVWDLKTGLLKNRLSEQSIVHETVCVAIDPSGQVIAAGYSDGTVRVWDSQSGSLLTTFSGHKSAVSILRFDQYGTRLVSGSRDCNIVVWDIVGEVGLYRFKGHRDQITGLEFYGENEQYLLSSGKDGLVKIWDLDIQHCVETHVAHRGECWGFTINVSNNVIASVGQRDIKTWTLDLTQQDGKKLNETGTLPKQVGEQRPVALKFDPSGSYLGIANADKSVEVWRRRTSHEIKKSIARKQKRRREKGLPEDENIKETNIDEIYVPHAVVRTSGKCRGFDWAHKASTTKRLHIVVSLSNNLVETFNIDTSGENDKKTKKGVLAEYNRAYSVELPGHRTDVRSVALSADNRLLISAANGSLKLWNTKTSNCLRTLDCGYALCTAFLPGDSLVLTGTKEGTLLLHDIASSSVVCEIAEAHSGAIWSLDVGADGKTIVTAGADKAVKFWQIKVRGDDDAIDPFNANRQSLKLKQTRILELTDDILAVKLSSDGKYLAASLLDNTVKVFFTDTLKFYLNLYGHKLPVLSIDISHDSKLLISCSADKNVKIWGLDFGDCHKSIFAHQDSVMKVAFEPQTHNFFSVGKDRMVKYWDGDKFEQIQKLAGHQSEVWALAVASDASFVVSASHDKSIRIWDLTDDQLFLEEEREKELEEMYESNLASTLNEEDSAGRQQDEDVEMEDSVERAGKQTIETLKAGEKLLEALEIGAKDLQRIASGSTEPRNIILQTLNVSAEKYVLDVLQKIKASQLEDALLIFPFDRVITLIEFLSIWASKKWNPSLICRVLMIIMRVYQKQLVANKVMRPALETLSKRIKQCLSVQKSEMGFNLAGLTYIKTSWEMDHQREFIDPADATAEQDRMAKKRAFTTA